MQYRLAVTIGALITLICIATAGMGLFLVIKANGMPAHSDKTVANHLTRSYEENRTKMSGTQRSKLETQIASLRTSKWALETVGRSLTITSVLLLLGIFWFRLINISNSSRVTTPRTRGGLLTLASVAWLALVPAIQIQIETEYEQDDFLPTTDTGHGTFLVFGVPIIVVTWIFVLLIVYFGALRRAALPVNLWRWDRTYHCTISTVVFGVFICLLVAAICWAEAHFVWGLPTLMIGIYIALSTRVALLSSRARERTSE
jgi:hypothetical protein